VISSISFCSSCKNKKPLHHEAVLKNVIYYRTLHRLAAFLVPDLACLGLGGFFAADPTYSDSPVFQACFAFAVPDYPV
jgi:hypothetical protein